MDIKNRYEPVMIAVFIKMGTAYHTKIALNLLHIQVKQILYSVEFMVYWFG